MKEGGVIACEAPRHPWPPLHPASRALLIETARRLDALVLRWARVRDEPRSLQIARVSHNRLPR